MNKVEIDLETYNKLYDNQKNYEDLEKNYFLLNDKYNQETEDNKTEIEILNKEINNLLFNILNLDSNKYVDNKICNFNISNRDDIAKYITENYLEKANKMFEDKEVKE